MNIYRTQTGYLQNWGGMWHMHVHHKLPTYHTWLCIPFTNWIIRPFIWLETSPGQLSHSILLNDVTVIYSNSRAPNKKSPWLPIFRLQNHLYNHIEPITIKGIPHAFSKPFTLHPLAPTPSLLMERAAAKVTKAPIMMSCVSTEPSSVPVRSSLMALDVWRRRATTALCWK